MCKPKAPKVPAVVQRDPVAEQAAADAKAQQEANMEIATRRRKLKASSLFTIGQQGVRNGPGFSAYSAANAVTKSNSLGGA